MEGHKIIFLILANLLLFLSDPTKLLLIHSQLLPIVDDQGDTPSRTQTYIVHVVRPEGSIELLGDEDLEAWHKSFLPTTTLDSGEPRLVYSYRHAISGFAARLTPEEVEAMKAIDGFVQATPDQRYELKTTDTPKFLGLLHSTGAWPNSSFGEGIIIGVIDTGILPNHPSFRDDGMLSPPKRWKGKCDSTVFAGCNKKIIGGVTFNHGKKSYSPVDDGTGHGTHVASIAAGNFVRDASVLGMAKGVASGMAPRAHLAIYKVAKYDIPGSDVLAGIDQAIADGVDVITISLGANPDPEFDKDPVAMGFLSAVEKNISVVTVAGNAGPNLRTLDHSAPWAVIVGASTTDRRAVATVKLGNNVEIEGTSAFQPATFNPSKMLPFVAPIDPDTKIPAKCSNAALRNTIVTGMIVVCLTENGRIDLGKRVKDAGAAGMILTNLESYGYTPFTEPHLLPASHVSYAGLVAMGSYSTSSKKSTPPVTPTATIIFKGTQYVYRPSPSVGFFSSRGPSQMNGLILKPDVLAPGVDILGAWHQSVGPNPSSNPSMFDFQSGTSMAAPHVAGIIALIKNLHPKWSPAAIQSAIVTSASDLDLDKKKIVDENHKPADVFATGAGQVNPAGAMDPGLVYDLKPHDYIRYLCGLGYTDTKVTAIVRRSINCSKLGRIDAYQLNYPSISVTLNSRRITYTVEVTRTVTNVGPAKSTYKGHIEPPSGVTVHLNPDQLSFSKVDEQATFTVKFSIISESAKRPRFFESGKLQWVSSDKKHVVTSPLVVTFG